MTHANFAASVLRDKGFPAIVRRNSNLDYFVAIESKSRKLKITLDALTVALSDMIESGLVTVKVIGGVGIVNINE